MFRKNEAHLQAPWISSIDELPEKVLRRLEASWASTFYREFFVRIDESQFAVLYSDQASRPNVPVNVLFALECLKVKFSWSDEEMYDAFLFDLQVRLALGYRNLGDGYFDLRTLYNFRARLSILMQQTGRNLVDEVFVKITDQQLAAYHLQSDKLRMDSTQVASNIREMSRLQLLVEVLQRVHRLLAPADQAHYAADFAPYLKGSSGQYAYHVKPGGSMAHVAVIGHLMHKLVAELAAAYGDTPAYQMLARVFSEHFVLENRVLRTKTSQEVSADSLQAPDDAEATCRTKRGETYHGYVVNATETCHPENPFQLIVDTQVESNTTDDGELLAAALPELAQRTAVQELHTDGGYNGEKSDAACAQAQVVHVQTALRGNQPTGKHVSLAEYAFAPPDHGTPIQVTCPAGQTVPVARARKRWRAVFNAELCAACPLFGTTCLVDPGKHKNRATFRFDDRDLAVARRRRRSLQTLASGHSLRPAIEATIRSLKLPFRNDKLPVRGRFRVAMMIIASAAIVNIQRIHRYSVERTIPAPAARTKPAICRGLLARLARIFAHQPSVPVHLPSAWPALLNLQYSSI